MGGGGFGGGGGGVGGGGVLGPCGFLLGGGWGGGGGGVWFCFGWGGWGGGGWGEYLCIWEDIRKRVKKCRTCNRKMNVECCSERDQSRPRLKTQANLPDWTPEKGERVIELRRKTFGGWGSGLGEDKNYDHREGGKRSDSVLSGVVSRARRLFKQAESPQNQRRFRCLV